MLQNNYQFKPYLSTVEAFLSFIGDFKDFQAQQSGKVYLRTGPKEPTSMLRPREILGLILLANVATFLSGDEWVPGFFLDENGNHVLEYIAHDGGIQCVSGPRKGAYMHFEQAMATQVAADATPQDIESALIREVNRKSARKDEYVEGTTLIILSDYAGVLSDLRQLARNVSHSKYQAIYLIAVAAPDFTEFVCVILKSSGDTLGPISVKFKRADGVAEVSRLR